MKQNNQQEYLEKAPLNNWKPQNRRTLFRTLKRGNQISIDSTQAKECKKKSSKFKSTDENTNIENKDQKSCYNSATEDLFKRSVFALEQRSHRTNLIPDPLGPDDIPYHCPQKKIKNYKPPSERVTESAENRKKFCDNYIEELKTKAKDNYPFAPTIVSKQTNQTHNIFSTERKIQKEIETKKSSPVINQKSKEIAERLADSTTIYSRQSSKIYHNPKIQNEYEQNYLKMPQKEIDKLIFRLTNQEQDLSSDSEEKDKYRNTTIEKKTIERLVLDSFHKNQSRNKPRPDENTYKPNLNQKSVELVSKRSSKPRDLYIESLVEIRKKERKVAILKNYKEMQDLQDCIPYSRMNQSPSYLNHVKNTNLYDIREKNEQKQVQPLEPYLFDKVEPKPFSFDKLSKKEKM